MLAVFLTLMVAVQSGPAPQKIDLHWVYVNSYLGWESPPKELKKGYTVAENARLIVLFPGGEYAQVSGTLFVIGRMDGSRSARRVVRSL